MEGYTTFGWVVVLALVHLLPLEDRLYSLVVQLICMGIGVGYIVGTYRLGRSLGFPRNVCVSGAVIPAIYYPLTLWNLQGMETGFLTCLLVWAAALSADRWRRKRVSYLGGVLFGAAMCTRPDALLIIGSIYLLFSPTQII